MKTSISFFHKNTNEISNCGDPLNITLSSKNLNWDGVLLERGSSPHFYPKDVTTPNFYFAMEMEHTYKWNTVISGDSVSMQTAPGDLWINPPNTPFTHNIDVPCYFLIINITEEKMFKSFGNQLSEKLTFLNNYSIQDKTLQHLMYLLYIEVESGGKNGQWFVDHILSLFSNHFIKNYSNYDDVTKNITSSSIIGPCEMQIINKIIRENISESVSIEDLSQALNISKFHFLNEFKKYNGITPYQHILNTRIDLSKDLLSSSNRKIIDIAHELGFSDSSHFIRTFKKVFGVSPTVFRTNLDQNKTPQ